MTSDQELIARVRRPHRIIEEDCWFSCPLAKDEDGSWSSCRDFPNGRTCDCGADAANEALNELSERLGRYEQREAELTELLQRAVDTFVPNHDMANALATKIGLGELPDADLVREIRQALTPPEPEKETG